MRKTLIQGVITILLFFGTWFVLKQIDWVKVFNVQKVTNKTEQKLGELLWAVFSKNEKENTSVYVVNSLDSIVTFICKANNIERLSKKVHILDNEDINAFALPNEQLIIFSGLILNSENQEELIGVICHEIAHTELNHVMKKLVKEIGLSVLLSMSAGNAGSEIIKETAKILSSSAYDRTLEKEADIKAVEYMVRAKINPEPFANFLYRQSAVGNNSPTDLTWISTHPDSKERAEYIIVHFKQSKLTDFKPILNKRTWEKLKDELKNSK